MSEPKLAQPHPGGGSGWSPSFAELFIIGVAIAGAAFFVLPRHRIAHGITSSGKLATPVLYDRYEDEHGKMPVDGMIGSPKARIVMTYQPMKGDSEFGMEQTGPPHIHGRKSYARLRQKANGVSSQIDVEWAVPTKRMSAATLKRKLKDETATNVLALGHRMPYQRTRIAGMNAYVWQGVSGSHGILGRYGAGEYSRETWVQSDKMSVTILCEGGHNEDIAAFSARCAQLTSSLKVY